eukprot:257206-Rhodomonas_salina.1
MSLCRSVSLSLCLPHCLWSSFVCLSVSPTHPPTHASVSARRQCVSGAAAARQADERGCVWGRWRRAAGSS